MSLTERQLSAVLVDVDGTLTESNSVAWIDLTELIYLKADQSMAAAKQAGQKHKEIFGEYRKEVAGIKDLQLREEKFSEMRANLFALWRASGLDLTRKNIRQISREVVYLRMRKDGFRFLEFLKILREQLNIDVYVITGAFSVLAEALAQEYGLSGGRANSQFTFDRDSDDALWTSFEHDDDLSRNKVSHVFDMKDEGLLNYPRAQIMAIGDGPTDDELVAYFRNNIILTRPGEKGFESIHVQHYVNSLDEAMKILYEQLGPDGAKLELPEHIDHLLRHRNPV